MTVSPDDKEWFQELADMRGEPLSTMLRNFLFGFVDHLGTPSRLMHWQPRAPDPEPPPGTDLLTGEPAPENGAALPPEKE